MHEFSWTSDKRLLHEVARRFFAGFGLSVAVSVALLFTGYKDAALFVAALGIGFAVVFAVTTPKTSIRIENGTLYYGTSQRVPLQGLRAVNLSEKRNVGKVLYLQTPTRRFFVPVMGVPNDVREKLLSLLHQRIDAG